MCNRLALLSSLPITIWLANPQILFVMISEKEKFCFICKTPFFPHFEEGCYSPPSEQEEISWKSFLFEGFSTQLQNKHFM
jgi:hypothetical protein